MTNIPRSPLAASDLPLESSSLRARHRTSRWSRCSLALRCLRPTLRPHAHGRTLSWAQRGQWSGPDGPGPLGWRLSPRLQNPTSNSQRQSQAPLSRLGLPLNDGCLSRTSPSTHAGHRDLDGMCVTLCRSTSASVGAPGSRRTQWSRASCSSHSNSMSRSSSPLSSRCGLTGSSSLGKDYWGPCWLKTGSATETFKR